MNIQQINSLLGKIDDLKSLFVFGQRVLPFLEELFNFIQEIVPLLEEINTSISESKSKIPHASTHLSKVTRATELAATEVFDTVDAILSKLAEMKTHQNRRIGEIEQIIQIDEQISRMIREEADYPNAAFLAGIERLQQKKLQKHRSLMDFHKQMSAGLDEVLECTSDIMMSMQVQDITAQQIAAVNHLIASVEKKLGRLMYRLKAEDLETGDPHTDESQAFDPEATYDISGQRQNFADALFEKSASEKEASATQEEIDRIFKRFKSDPDDAEPPENE